MAGKEPTRGNPPARRAAGVDLYYETWNSAELCLSGKPAIGAAPGSGLCGTRADDVVSYNWRPLYPIKPRSGQGGRDATRAYLRQSDSFSDKIADTPRNAGYSAVIT